MIVERQSLDHLSVTSCDTCGYVTSPPRPPSLSLNSELPLLPVAQPHYSFPLPVGRCDVIVERGGQQQEPARDLDLPTSLILAGSRSLGDVCKENVILPQQQLAVEPARSFKTPHKYRGLLI